MLVCWEIVLFTEVLFMMLHNYFHYLTIITSYTIVFIIYYFINTTSWQLFYMMYY